LACTRRGAASEQLDKISPELRTHPDVLNVQWRICVNAKNWEAALDAASTMVLLEPRESLSWARLSYALHELKRTSEARDNLLRVVDTFPDNSTMRYNLACYECQLGRMEEAKGWLAEAFKLGGKRQMTRAALSDTDLERLESGSPSRKVSLCDGVARLPDTAPITRTADMVAA
jgi:Flp pilus assembly protein TadD